MRRTRVYAGATVVAAMAILSGIKLQPSWAQSDGSMDRAYISRMLDGLHDAASKADGEQYFSYFADGAVFLGTQGDERWAMREFREYAMPRFAEGKGWTYASRTRHIYLNDAGNAGWFDEILENQKYGICRGSGAVVKEGFEWKIVQYNLTVPIPNDLLPQVVEMIRAHDEAEVERIREFRRKLSEQEKSAPTNPGSEQ